MSNSEEKGEPPRSMSGRADDIVMLGKVIYSEAESSVRKMTELDLDHRFWSSISTDPIFRAWFLSKSKFAGKRLELATDEKWHQRWYRDPETRRDSETDILLIFTEEQTQSRVAFHIENKTLAGSWEPQQAEGYRRRAENRANAWRYADFELVLIAPSAFIAAHPDEARHFDRTISYEDIGAFVPDFRLASVPIV